MSTRSRQPCQFPSLTQEQVDELFRKYDRNGDGMITKDELTGVFPHLACPSTQTKKHGSKPLPASKPLPPQNKVNSKPCPTKPKEKPDEPHVLAPKVISKVKQQPKEKAKAKANESHENAHKVKEPKKKPDAMANQPPLHKVSSKAPAKPAKKIEDKAQKAPAIDFQKKGSIMRLSREQMKEIFREHDVDGDGFLDYGELTMAFGFLDSVLPCYKARNGITHADANGDGLISEDELDKLIDYAEKLYGEDLVY